MDDNAQSLDNIATIVGNLTYPQGEIKYKSVLYLDVLLSKGTITTIVLSQHVLKYFEIDHYLIALVKKENRPVVNSEDLLKRGYLLKFKEKVLATGKSMSSIVKTSSQNSRYALVESVEEVELLDFDSKTYLAACKTSPVPKLNEVEEKEYKSMVIDKLDKVLSKLNTTRSSINEYYGVDSLDELLNSSFRLLKSFSQLSRPKSMEYLETTDLMKRSGIILEALNNFYFSTDITKLATNESDKKSSAASPVSFVNPQKYRDLVNRIKNMSEDTKEELHRRIDYLESMRVDNGEKANIINYFETLCQIPWDVYDEGKHDLKEMREELGKVQYGMKDAKDRLIEFIAAGINKGGNFEGKVLCLVGSPGTGKTLFAQNAAMILKRKYTAIALGGINDVSILRGQRKGWIGAEPGQIIKALIRAKSMNPIIILEEIDKISSYHGDQVKAALLEILDPSQNRDFRDAYLDIPVDISKVLFIASGNYMAGLPLPLVDRMEIIQIPAYMPSEKFDIAKQFTIPQILKNVSLTDSDLIISDESIMKIIDSFRFDAGMRRVKQTLSNVVNKFLVEKLEGKITQVGSQPYTIDIEKLTDYVKLTDKPDGLFDPNSSVIGEINMLWVVVDDTRFVSGGGRSPIQIRFVTGKGKHILTGSLSDVTKQSISVAMDFLQIKSKELGLEADYFKKHDLFLHMPSISTPKDGSSAGLAITLGMISAIKELPVLQSYGMTGEMDLSGNALPIGSVRTKVASGYQAGLRTFVIPASNKMEFENDVDEEIKKNISVHFVSHISEAAKIFFPDANLSL